MLLTTISSRSQGEHRPQPQREKSAVAVPAWSARAQFDAIVPPGLGFVPNHDSIARARISRRGGRLSDDARLLGCQVRMNRRRCVRGCDALRRRNGRGSRGADRMRRQPNGADARTAPPIATVLPPSICGRLCEQRLWAEHHLSRNAVPLRLPLTLSERLFDTVN